MVRLNALARVLNRSNRCGRITILDIVVSASGPDHNRRPLFKTLTLAMRSKLGKEGEIVRRKIIAYWVNKDMHIIEIIYI